jgi:nitrogen fixation/metabolism regulation signal transduction histidine kinase
MLVAGLLPLLSLELLSDAAVKGFLSLSFTPVTSVIERAEDALDRCPTAGSAVGADLRNAESSLLQVELARRALREHVVPRAFYLALGLGTVLLVLAAFILSRGLRAPVERLSQGMLAYAQGQLTVQLPEKNGARVDELEFLIRQFNQMGRDLDASRRRLQESEQIAAWQDVARAMAHELKNPLTAMRMALARIARTDDQRPEVAAPGSPLLEAVDLLQDQLAALMRMTQDFSAFAKLSAPRPARLSLGSLIDEVCRLYENQASHHILRPAPEEIGIEVDADGDQLRRVVGNLLKNAIEASGTGDEAIRIGVERAADTARVTIDDGGVGIPAPLSGRQLMRSIGSTKAEGSGLGLTICYKIVHDHGGALRLEPRPGRGTRAIVELPLAAGAAAAPARTSEVASA